MSNELKSDLWVDKYRPTKLDDYILDNDIRQYFKSMLQKHTIQNISLLGIAGSGKTTLAKILCNELNADVLFVPCSTEGTVDVLRTKIQEFCNALSFDGRLKIVLLDELDSASSGATNNFQQALRTLIEEAQNDTRFILTGNYIQKIIAPLLSRCPVIPLKYSKKDLLLHVKKILDAENIVYTRESVKTFIDEAFQYYPDCRRIINYLQFCCSSGELVVKITNADTSEKHEFIAELVNKLSTCNNLIDVRKFYLSHKDKITDYVEAGSDLFNYVVDNEIVTSLDGILKLTDLQFYMNTVIDKESNFFGMITAVAKWMNSNER